MLLSLEDAQCHAAHSHSPPSHQRTWLCSTSRGSLQATCPPLKLSLPKSESTDKKNPKVFSSTCLYTELLQIIQARHTLKHLFRGKAPFPCMHARSNSGPRQCSTAGQQDETPRLQMQKCQFSVVQRGNEMLSLCLPFPVKKGQKRKKKEENKCRTRTSPSPFNLQGGGGP